jgi:uncharacterized protein DUF87
LKHRSCTRFCFRIASAQGVHQSLVAAASEADPGMPHHTHIGHTSAGAAIGLTSDQRLRHIAMFGSTGVGKSTLLLNTLAQDIARGDGALLLDPHGDLSERALSIIPTHRRNHVCYLNLADLEFPVGINLLEDVPADQRAVVVDGLVSAARAIWHDFWGPRLEQILRHSARALLEYPNASLVIMPRLLTDDEFRARVVARVSDPLTQTFFGRRFSEWQDSYREEAIDPVLNKIDAFIGSIHVRNVVGQSTSTLHFEHAMNAGRIIIANLSRGLVGETSANLMGAFLLARAQAAAMARAALPPAERRPFHILIDEAQNFGAGGIIAQLLSESRKYAVSIVLATQYIAAIAPPVRASLLGNVHTLIAFRVGHDDAEALAPEFNRPHQDFNPYALRQLERGEAMVRVAGISDGDLVSLPLEPTDRGSAQAVKKQSRLHYGTRRELVEERIWKVLVGPDNNNGKRKRGKSRRRR